MVRSVVENSDLARCLLCHDAPCEAACPTQVPISRILTGLRAGRPHFEPAPGAESVNLSCDLCGVTLENPFLLSSSVVASNYEMCVRAFEMGWAGISYKTMCTMDIHETSPRFSAVKDGSGAFYGFKNIEQLSPHSMEEDLEILSRLKRNYPSKVIVASIMGQNEAEWTQLARAVSDAGADVLELNFSCPNMEEKGVGVDIGQNPEAVRRFTAAARRGTDKPILAKMTPNLADMRPAARAAMAGGANGIAAIRPFALTAKPAGRFLCRTTAWAAIFAYWSSPKKPSAPGASASDRPTSQRNNATEKPSAAASVTGRCG